jgi:hypothetical protein
MRFNSGQSGERSKQSLSSIQQRNDAFWHGRVDIRDRL